jgi:hypothetical protein
MLTPVMDSGQVYSTTWLSANGPQSQKLTTCYSSLQADNYSVAFMPLWYLFKAEKDWNVATPWEVYVGINVLLKSIL